MNGKYSNTQYVITGIFVLVALFVLVRTFPTKIIYDPNTRKVADIFSTPNSTIAQDMDSQKDENGTINDDDPNLYVSSHNTQENANNGFVRVNGFRSADYLIREITLHSASLKYLFHKNRISPPKDPIYIRLWIDQYGRVLTPEIFKPDTLSMPTRTLILSDISQWHFAQIKKDGETEVEFPLQLKNRLESP